MLHLNHLKKSFGKTEILTDVEYIFNKGGIYPILGGPGAVRTKFLLILNIHLKKEIYIRFLAVQEQEEQLCLSVSQEILL